MMSAYILLLTLTTPDSVSSQAPARKTLSGFSNTRRSLTARLLAGLHISASHTQYNACLFDGFIICSVLFTVLLSKVYQRSFEYSHMTTDAATAALSDSEAELIGILTK